MPIPSLDLEVKAVVIDSFSEMHLLQHRLMREVLIVFL